MEISISSPSLRSSASTTAAGRRTAKLLPHLQTCIKDIPNLLYIHASLDPTRRLMFQPDLTSGSSDFLIIRVNQFIELSDAEVRRLAQADHNSLLAFHFARRVGDLFGNFARHNHEAVLIRMNQVARFDQKIADLHRLPEV